MFAIITLLWQNLYKSAFNYKLSLIDTFGMLGVRSLFGGLEDAIAVLGCWGCDRCFGVWECVSVALLEVVCFLWV
ncbi:MAG: hypothetical protein ACK6A9_17760 [Dolichospermum sp.]|jgi:hypothetical protein